MKSVPTRVLSGSTSSTENVDCMVAPLKSRNVVTNVILDGSNVHSFSPQNYMMLLSVDIETKDNFIFIHLFQIMGKLW